MQTYRKIKYGSSSSLASELPDNYRYETNDYDISIEKDEKSISAQYRIGLDVRSSDRKDFIYKQVIKLKAVIKTARLYQWSKNILLFLPLCFLSEFRSVSVLNLCVGFFMLGLCASSVYFINDVLDKESDRLHPRKKFRPLAAGTLSSLEACGISCILLSTSIVFSILGLGTEFSICLGCYFGLTLMYSLYLKKVPIIDVMILALLYTLRIYMGAVILGINLSMLVYACSIGGFLSLALLKRSVELSSTSVGERINQRRGYILEDKSFVTTFGCVTGVSSTIFMVMYFYSTFEVYKYPQALIGICLGYTYWLSYMLLMTERGRMHDDPVFFATTNIQSYIILICVGISWIVAKGMVF